MNSYFSSIVWVLFILTIMVVFIVYVIRFLSVRNRMFSQGFGLKTLGGLGLGPNKSLQIVQVSDRIYVLGVGDTIQCIDCISDPDAVEKLIQDLQAIEPLTWRKWLSFKQPDFQDELRKQMDFSEDSNSDRQMKK